MTVNAGLFTSTRADWETPQDLFDKLNGQFGFKLDACATPETAKCPRYFTPEDDALSQEWHPYGSVFMNPPYGREIGAWVEKAYREALNGCTVVCLLPARTDTRWFHGYCLQGEIRFLPGRLKFSGYKNSAPFPSMIVIFGGSP